MSRFPTDGFGQASLEGWRKSSGAEMKRRSPRSKDREGGGLFNLFRVYERRRGKKDREDKVIDVNSSWRMHDINKSMLQRRRARHGSAGDLVPAPPSGAEQHHWGVGGGDMETISHRLFQYRFNYSANLTAWVWFVLRTSIKCVNT